MGLFDDIVNGTPSKDSRRKGAFDDIVNGDFKQETGFKTKSLAELLSDNAQQNTLEPGAKVVSGLPGVLEVGARRGYAGIGKIEQGALSILSDLLSGLPGSEALSSAAEAVGSRARQIENSAVLRGQKQIGFAPDSIANDVPEAGANAVSSVIQTAPSLLAGAIAPVAALPALFANTYSQEYAQGKDAGLSGGKAALRAVPMAAFEVAGEKLGGFDRLAEGLRAATRGNGVADLGTAMVSSALKEIPSEEFTTTGQFLTDKAPVVGLNQDATLADYGQQVKDTALTTALQSGAMGAAGRIIKRLNLQAPSVKDNIQPQPAPQTQAAPQINTPAIVDAISQAVSNVKPSAAEFLDSDTSEGPNVSQPTQQQPAGLDSRAVESQSDNAIGSPAIELPGPVANAGGDSAASNGAMPASDIPDGAAPSEPVASVDQQSSNPLQLPIDFESEAKNSPAYNQVSLPDDVKSMADQFSVDEVNKLLSEAGYVEPRQPEIKSAGGTSQIESAQPESAASGIAGDQGRQAGQTARAEPATKNEVAGTPGSNEREGTRQQVEAIVKRRAAANQIGKSKPFDNALKLAKDFMNGEDVSPAKFKNAAIMFANDKPLADAFTALAELAKAPARENRQSARSAMDVFTEQINNAKTVDELKSISRNIQMETGIVSDAMAQQLDDLVMERIDALDNSGDLLGDNTEQQQALADAERAKDEKRNAVADNASDFVLTGSDRPADQAAASGAQDLLNGDESSFKRDPMMDAIASLKQQQNQIVDDVKSYVDQVTEGWKNAPVINVVYDLYDTKVPQEIRDLNEEQEQGGATGTPSAFIYKNRVYIVASQMTSAKDVLSAVFHESLGHYGLRGVFQGKQAINAALSRVANMRSADVAKKAKQYGLDISKEADRLLAAEEVLAEMAETKPEIGVVKQVIAAIRSWLRENIPYFKNLELSDAEIIRDYILPARRYVETGGKEQSASDVVAAFQRSNSNTDITEDQLKRSMLRDELGRWKSPTSELISKADSKIKVPFTDKRFSEISKILIDSIAFGQAPKELRTMTRLYKADIQKAMEAASNVVKTMAPMSQLDRALVSDVVEKMVQAGVTPPEHIVNIATGMQNAMDIQTDELVKLGMLSQDSADRWRGRYLPRFYMRENTEGVKAWVGKMLRNSLPVRGIGGNSLKGRGLFEEVNVNEVPKYESLGWEVRDPLWKKNRQGELELVDANKAVTPEKVVVWRDWTPSERAEMGENRDALFRFVMGYTSMQNDIALGRLFDSIAKNQEWTRARASDGFVKVPDSEIPDTGGVKRYGNLSGLYVKKEILDHISQYEEASELWKYYRKALSFWKSGKTVLNPVAHVNNVVSNLTMAHFAGVSYWDVHKYIGALKDFFKNAPMIQEAKDRGLMTGDITRAELMEDMPDDIKEMMQMQEPKVKRSAELVFKLVCFSIPKITINQQDSALKKMGKTVLNRATPDIVKWMGKAYRFEDDFFKYLIYRDARKNGLSPDDAVDYATKYIFTYDDLPKGARTVRDLAIPFFAYTYKAVPALTHTLFNYPWRFAAPAAAIGGVNALAYALAASDDDDEWYKQFAKIENWIEFLKGSINTTAKIGSFGLYDGPLNEKGSAIEEKERKNLPPWMQGRGALGTQKSIRLGTDEKTQLPVYMDVSRMIPGGDIFDVTNQADGVPVPAPIMPSNPVLTTIAAMFWNKDTFTGKEVTDLNDTGKEAAQKRAEWLLKQLSPAIAPTGYHADRLAEAVAQMSGDTIETPWKDYTGYGKDGLPVQGKYAVGQTFGIKARPIDLERSAEISQGQDNKEIRSIMAEVRQAARLLDQKAISQREYDRRVSEAEEKINAIENK